MSHLNVILHENYPGEHIEDWEHDVVREECESIGFLNVATTRGVKEHLPRGCYFSEDGTPTDVERAYENLGRRLGRSLSIESTLGRSYGFGLKPVVESYGSEYASWMWAATASMAEKTPSSGLGLFAATAPARVEYPNLLALLACGEAYANAMKKG